MKTEDQKLRIIVSLSVDKETKEYLDSLKKQNINISAFMRNLIFAHKNKI